MIEWVKLAAGIWITFLLVLLAIAAARAAFSAINKRWLGFRYLEDDTRVRYRFDEMPEPPDSEPNGARIVIPPGDYDADTINEAIRDLLEDQ